MKILGKWKKITLAVMAAIFCMGIFSIPVLAHGHHNNNHHQSGNTNPGTYCPYHHSNHQNPENCQNYCNVHHSIHQNMSDCQNYCSYHHSVHQNVKDCSHYCPGIMLWQLYGKMNTR